MAKELWQITRKHLFSLLQIIKISIYKYACKSNFSQIYLVTFIYSTSLILEWLYNHAWYIVIPYIYIGVCRIFDQH